MARLNKADQDVKRLKPLAEAAGGSAAGLRQCPGGAAGGAGRRRGPESVAEHDQGQSDGVDSTGRGRGAGGEGEHRPGRTQHRILHDHVAGRWNRRHAASLAGQPGGQRRTDAAHHGVQRESDARLRQHPRAGLPDLPEDEKRRQDERRQAANWIWSWRTAARSRTRAR